MSYEIIKRMKPVNGQIEIEHASNNVFPRYYKTFQMEDTPETRELIKKYLIDRIWKPCHKNTKFIKSLGITHYFDKTPFYTKQLI